MAERFSKWDMADDIRDAEDVEAYLNAWLEGCDAHELAYLLGCIARSEGMTNLARRTGLNRVSLYGALSERQPVSRHDDARARRPWATTCA